MIDVNGLDDKAYKLLENRMRRALARQGYRLVKSRARDQRALSYGGYLITGATSNIVEAGGQFEMDLEDVQRFVEE
jgi:hypothetical protein